MQAFAKIRPRFTYSRNYPLSHRALLTLWRWGMADGEWWSARAGSQSHTSRTLTHSPTYIEDMGRHGRLWSHRGHGRERSAAAAWTAAASTRRKQQQPRHSRVVDARDRCGRLSAAACAGAVPVVVSLYSRELPRVHRPAHWQASPSSGRGALRVE